MCDIYKRALLPTARRQFGLNSTVWELEENNDPQTRVESSTELESKSWNPKT